MTPRERHTQRREKVLVFVGVGFLVDFVGFLIALSMCRDKKSYPGFIAMKEMTVAQQLGFL